MKRNLVCIVATLGTLVMVACGQRDTSEHGNTSTDGSPGAVETGVVTAVATVLNETTPTVDIGVDVEPEVMIAAALEFSRWREVIVSGEPEVLLAVPGTPHTMYSMGLNIGNWDPACTRPMYLVILKGDFDGSNLFVSPANEGEGAEGPQGQYLGYVFDLTGGVPGDVSFSIMSDDGAVFKQALRSSELPDWEFAVPQPEAPFIPCEDVIIEGNPEPDPEPTTP